MEATTARAQATRRELVLPAVVTALAAGTVVYGLTAGDRGVELGVALPPFLVAWEPRAEPAAAGAAVLLVASIAHAPRQLSAAVSPARVAAAATPGRPASTCRRCRPSSSAPASSSTPSPKWGRR